MLTKIIIPTLAILTLSFTSCKGKQSVKGEWKIVKVKMWDNYNTLGLILDNSTKSVNYTGTDSATAALFSPTYKDSLLQISSSSYLQLNSDSTFQLYDQGFLTQALSDTDWQGTHEGRWTINTKKDILTLIQTSSIKKSYTILNLNKEQLVLGELYEDEPTHITEITLRK